MVGFLSLVSYCAGAAADVTSFPSYRLPLRMSGLFPILADDEDPIRADLEKARKAFKEETDAFQKAVDSHFDAREDLARKDGTKKLVDQIKAERQEFKQTGRIPKTLPAQTRQKMSAGRTSMINAYNQAIKDYTKLKKDQEAEAIEKELDAFTKKDVGAPSVSKEATKLGFLDKVFTDADGEHPFVLFVPKDYKGDKEYPVILFLHGAGETGTDGKRQSQTGIGPAIKKREKSFGFITIMPQAETRGWGADGPNAKRALAILEQVQKEYKTDPKRVYLTGLSMGGFGTWSLAAKYPDKWAAIAPVCGGGNVKDAAKLKDLPIWNFHGDADTAVKVDLSRNLIKAIEEAGGKPKYTEYPGVGHNSWDKAYGTDELYTWFLSHTKDKKE
jgi:predicted peptidase